MLLAVLAAALLERAPDAPPGYRIQQSVALEEDARLEVLRDERLTSDVVWEANEGMTCAKTSDDPKLTALCASLQKEPLRHGMVRLVAKSGRVLDQREFERETVWVETSFLRGRQHSVFEVTVDDSTGVGSYRGSLTRFAEPYGGKFHWFATRDEQTGKVSDLLVLSSLKSGWKIVSHGQVSDILAVRCRPDFGTAEGEQMAFQILYERYRFDGRVWLRTQRSEPGYLDVEEAEFPSEDKFPR